MQKNSRKRVLPRLPTSQLARPLKLSEGSLSSLAKVKALFVPQALVPTIAVSAEAVVTRGQDKKIPEYLWKQVSQILPHYRQQKILSTLRLNHDQLRQNLDSIPRYQPLLKKVTDTQQFSVNCFESSVNPVFRISAIHLVFSKQNVGPVLLFN